MGCLRFEVASFWAERFYVTPKKMNLALCARQVGVVRESVRRWVVQADTDDAARGGVTSVGHAETKRPKLENTGLREGVVILRAATSSFLGELDPRNQ